MAKSYSNDSSANHNPYQTIISEDYRVNAEGQFVKNIAQKPTRSAITRFLEKLEVSQIQFYNGSPCWIWKGCKGKSGYGQFKSDGRRGAKKSSPHIFSHEYFIGTVPEGYEVDHLCNVRDCANPLHLEAVTQQENHKRRAARITHCKNGHEFTEDNTSYIRSGDRACRACRNEAARKFNARNPHYYDKYHKK